jgi:hypothetical protein
MRHEKMSAIYMMKSAFVHASNTVYGIKYRLIILRAMKAFEAKRLMIIATIVSVVSIARTRHKKVPRFVMKLIVVKPACLNFSLYGFWNVNPMSISGRKSNATKEISIL